MASFCSEVSHSLQAVTRVYTPPAGQSLAGGPAVGRARAAVSALAARLVPLGTTLHEAGDCLRQVCFPIDALVSLTTNMDDGSSTEIGAVGNQGLVGLAIIMGGESSPTRALVVQQGFAFCASRAALMEMFPGTLALQQLLLRYAQTQLTQVAQPAACNRRLSSNCNSVAGY